MSRSNNYRGEAGHVPPPPPPVPPRQTAQNQQAHWPQAEPPPQGYIPPPLPHAAQGYEQPQQGGYYFPPPAVPQQAHGHQTHGHPAHGYDAHGQPLAGQPPARQHAPPPLSSYVPATQNQPWPAEPAAGDPHGYDLGQYAAGQPSPGYDRPPPDFGHYGAHPAAPQQGYYPQHAAQAYPAPHDQQGYAPDPYAQHGAQAGQQLRVPPGQHTGYDQHGHSLEQGEHELAVDEEEFEDDDYAEEPPRRGKRSLMVVAALVGAIGIGGGLAYGYKKFAGPSAGKQQLAKVEPAKKAAGAVEAPPERKIAERLPDVVPQAAVASPAASENQDVGGPRKVQLIPITPSGVPGAVVAAAPPAPAPARPTINVPGVTLENAVPPPPVRVPAAAPPPPAPPVATAAVAPQQPRPVAVARPTAPPPAAAEPPAEAPKKVAKAPAVKTKSNDAFTPGATATASVAAPAAKATGGNGFVAVLASQKSRMDALKVYADLQQKYGDVLSNKPADVQEANLGDKGVYFRAVVGPPGSREAASTLCTQLKTAGYTGCWVTAY